MNPRTITRIYIRTYTDNGQQTLYVDWSDRSRTECDAEEACKNQHMQALVRRANQQGLRVEREIW